MLTQNSLTFLVIFFGGGYRFAVLQLLSLTEWFFIQISIIHDNISLHVDYKRRQGFGQWIDSSIIQDNICSLVNKKCHPKSYCNDTKYYMALTIIFSVAPPMKLTRN